MPVRAALVAALIVERPTCRSCIEAKSSLSPTDFETTLVAIRGALRVHEAVERCRACGESKSVLSLDRPGG